MTTSAARRAARPPIFGKTVVPLTPVIVSDFPVEWPRWPRYQIDPAAEAPIGSGKMGWCTEFAHPIRQHCNEPMVAGEASCSCPSCGATCTGLFSACPQVWAHAHQPVFLRLSPPAERPKPAPLTATTPSNGGGSPRPAPQIDPKPAPASNGNGSVARDLLAEMRSLNVRIEQAGGVSASRRSDEAPLDALSAQLKLLPDQIARGLAGALREQHRVIMDDMKALLDEVLDEFTAARSTDERE